MPSDHRKPTARHTLVVGIEDEPAGRDAIAPAAELAPVYDAQILLATAYPFVFGPDGGADERAALHADVRAVPAASTVRALHHLAGGQGPAGRALLGSTSAHVVHEASCPVLVVPAGVPAELGGNVPAEA